ncbi:MAG: hypothetical protein KIS92_23445, partial [Planctomycetota bacterium]|nr:hypothetical protein [Planctomycetota bacterium]
PPPPPPPTQRIVITFSPAGPYAVGDRVTVRAYLPGAPRNAQIRLTVPGIGTVTGRASGTTVRGRVSRAGTQTVTARLVNSNLNVPVARAQMTVVGMRRLSASDRVVRLDNGSASITFTPTTNPSGYNSMVEWRVTPNRNSSITRHANGSVTVRFTRDGAYTIRASVGDSSRSIEVDVQPEPHRRR